MKELGYDFDEIHHNLAKKSKPLLERRVVALGILLMSHDR